MYGLQKFKEFINDLGSTINEFASIPAQHDPHHTRDAQLRRRSSWSDLSSFFKFNNKGAARPEEAGIEQQQPAPGNSMKSLPASTSANVQNRPSSSSSAYGKPQQKSKSQVLSRSPSLRINSNGNVVTSSSKHRRVSNNVHLLQYDSINKGSSVRYQPNTKTGMNKGHYPNSAPATPKGSHGSGLHAISMPSSRQNSEYRGQNPSSPLPRRANPTPNVQQNAHRRTSPHTQSNFTEQNIRDHNFHNNSKQYNNNDPRQQQDNRIDNSRYDIQSHEPPRSRTSSDSRKHANQQLQQHGRQELSKENLDTFNHYGNVPYESSDRRELHRDNPSNRSTRSLQESGIVPIHLDNRYVVQQDDKYHIYDQRSPHGRDNRIDNRQNYPPINIESNFRPVESYTREIHGHHSNDRYEHDYRNQDYSGNHVNPSVPKVGSLYRKDFGNPQNIDNKSLGRDGYPTSKPSPVDPHKVDPRLDPRLSGSPRTSQLPPQQQQGGGRYSPNHNFNSADNELLNGAPSQQFYDNMISQITNQIARVSEGGASTQQPFNTILQKSAPPPAPPLDDDDNEWC